MTTTLSPPIRIVALLAALAAIGLGVVLFTQSRNATSSTPAPVAPISKVHARTATKPVATSVHKTKPAKVAPRLVLVPGLPSSVAHALRYSDVVVVSLFARGAQGDGTARAQAAKGARAVHAGFVAINVLDESAAVRTSAFAGTTVSTPSVLVIKRPGRIVNRFDGFADSELVAQAAQNAGAGR